jgi:hypothetical protein
MNQSEAIHISNNLISTSFPELGHKRIRYRFVAGRHFDYYMAVRWVVFEYRIYLEKEILQFSSEAFTGCMAHELAHIIKSIKKPLLVDFWEFLTRSKNENSEERDADILVVERGLGKALLQFHQEHGKNYKSYIASEGLTKREIKKLLKGRS